MNWTRKEENRRPKNIQSSEIHEKKNPINSIVNHKNIVKIIPANFEWIKNIFIDILMQISITWMPNTNIEHWKKILKSTLLSNSYPFVETISSAWSETHIMPHTHELSSTCAIWHLAYCKSIYAVQRTISFLWTTCASECEHRASLPPINSDLFFLSMQYLCFPANIEMTKCEHFFRQKQ